jgi:hypothetical protein
MDRPELARYFTNRWLLVLTKIQDMKYMKDRGNRKEKNMIRIYEFALCKSSFFIYLRCSKFILFHIYTHQVRSFMKSKQFYFIDTLGASLFWVAFSEKTYENADQLSTCCGEGVWCPPY